jgi:hypothetical protein
VQVLAMPLLAMPLWFYLIFCVMLVCVCVCTCSVLEYVAKLQVAVAVLNVMVQWDFHAAYYSHLICLLALLHLVAAHDGVTGEAAVGVPA